MQRGSWRRRLYLLSAEPAYIPSTYTALPEDAADKMTRLMDMLDDCDDVQGFWHNWEM